MEGSMAKTEIIRDRVKSYFQHTVYGWLHLLVRIPNTETLDALRQARSQDGLNEYDDLEALKAEHG